MVVGGFVCFFGGPMITLVITVLTFIGLTGGLFLGFQSLNDAAKLYPAFAEKDQTAQLIIGGVCLLVAAGGTYLLRLKVVTKANAIKVVAFGGAALGTYLLVVGISMPGWAKVICMVAGGAIGVYLINDKENLIISYGTGLIGAVLLLHGLSCYVGGWPSVSDAKALADQKVSYEFIGYVVGVIVFTVAGGYRQMKKVEESDSDFFKQEDA